MGMIDQRWTMATSVLNSTPLPKSSSSNSSRVVEALVCTQS